MKFQAVRFFLVLFFATFCNLTHAANLKKITTDDLRAELKKVNPPKGESIDAKSGTLTLLVELEGEPAARVYGNMLKSGAGLKKAKSFAQATAQQNAMQQESMRRTIQGFGGTE